MIKTADFIATLFHGKDDPNKVTVAFTMAVNACRKGHSACLILMAEGVALGLPGAADDIAIGAPFDPVADLLNEYLELGGRVAVCKGCLVHNGFTPEQMDSRYEIISAGDVIDLTMNARGSLQVA